jgi:hypothetical protein
MSAWGKSDRKSISGTVTLTAPSITFNAATGHAAGVYTSAGHPFQLGDPVVYSNGSGTSVVGLTSGSTYYVTNVTANTFSLATTEDRALRNDPIIINSTDGIGSAHTFTVPLSLGRGTITGIDTFFEDDGYQVGDVIRVGNQEMIFIAIASETSATVINANPGTTLTTFTEQSYRVNEKPTSIASVATTDFESTQVFGVRSDEIHGDQSGGYISAVALIQGGTRYLEAPSVAFSGGGGSGAAATATLTGGVVTSIAVTNNGSSYETAPTVNLDVPRRTILASNVATATEQFTYTAHGLASAEEIKYYHGGGTAVTGLTNGTSYYVSALGLGADTFRLAASAVAAAGRTNLAGVAISGTGGQFTCTATTLAAGDHIVIGGTITGTGSITGHTAGKIYEVSAVTGTSPNVTGFTLTQEDGTALTTTVGNGLGLTYKPYTIVMISGAGNDAQYFDLVTATTATARAALGVNQGVDNADSGAVAHTGWVKRKVLTGAHAGRIQYEVLVALSKNGITSDAADDIEFPED